jgi:lysozyme
MKLHPRVTKTAVELVERFEGLRRKAARLPDGTWTIGYGHTKTAREGVEVSPEEAELLLYYDLSEVATRIDAWTFTPLNQNQFEALTAFAFNIGLENFKRSTVLKRVNEGQHLQAAAAMELWRKTEVDGEGLVSDALVRRRAAEKAHYLTPPEGFRPSPSQVLRPAFDFSVIEAASQSHTAQRATVIDTPLEGDETSANVEGRTEHVAEAEASAPTLFEPANITSVTQAAALSSEEQGAPVAVVDAPAAAFLAEEQSAPVVYAPEPEPESPAAAPVNDRHDAVGLDPFATAAAATATIAAALPAGNFVLRSFEPPPSRFGRPTETPTAANEYELSPPPTVYEPQLAVAEPVLPAAEPAPARPVSEFNLFDRPLAPPAPRAEAGDLDRPVRALKLRDDEELLDGPTPRAPKPRTPHEPRHGVSAMLHDRTFLFSSIGLLGVMLFFLAIATMLTGKATLGHLLIGFLGVVLITPAGVYFLMRRMAEAPESVAVPTSLQAEPVAEPIVDDEMAHLEP